MYLHAFTIKKQTIWMFITTIPLILSEGIIALLGINHQLLLLIRLVIATTIVLLCLCKRHLPGNVMFLLYIIYGTIFFTARFHGNFMTSIESLINSLVICVAFDYWLSYAYKDFIYYLRKILFILVISNFVTVVIFKDGLYETSIYSINWLLGQKNSHLTYIMMAIIIEGIYSYNTFKKIKFLNKLYMITCCISLYLVDAATGFMIATIYVIFLIVFVNYSNNKYVKLVLDSFSIGKIILVMLIVTIFVVFLQDMSFIENNFAGIFGTMNRDVSFTGRTVIWKKSIDLIKKNLWLGQGVVNSALFGKMTGIPAGTHAHNYILNILVMGGIICLLEHVILYAYIIRRIMYKKSFLAYMLGLAIGLYFISGLTGVNFYAALFNSIFVLTEYVLKYKEMDTVRKDSMYR